MIKKIEEIIVVEFDKNKEKFFSGDEELIVNFPGNIVDICKMIPSKSRGEVKKYLAAEVASMKGDYNAFYLFKKKNDNPFTHLIYQPMNVSIIEKE